MEKIERIEKLSTNVFDKPCRIWYVMLARDKWRGLVVNTKTNRLIVEGPISESADSALKHLELFLNVLGSRKRK